ncbi:MAG: universal stress protein [Bacteroidales bacterium]|nr:universal stress protein [Bacteroidales bacterium]
MDKKTESILILWDFSKSCEISLLHAIQLHKVVENKIILLYIIPSGGLFSNKSKIESQKKEAINKLKSIAEKTFNENKVKPEIIVEDGNVSKIIKKIMDKINTNLIIMGESFKLSSSTYSFKDILKATENYNIPVIMTTLPPTHTHYSEIVVPLDHHKKYKEKLHWIIFLSKYYNFNINIIKPYVSDELLKKQMANNVFFTKKMLDNKKIVYGIKTAKKTESFPDAIQKFTKDIEADLIVVMISEFNSYIANKNKSKAPVMCMTPRTDLRKFGGFN